MSLVENLYRDYGDFVLDIPRWEIPDQGITALLGPSGSGKTSAFRSMMGLESCSGLHWNFKGQDLAQLPVPQRRLGVVFQSLELFPHMSARENILFAAEARRIPKEQRAPKLDELAGALQLTGCLDRSAAVLSGGEQQRVALARALIGEPQFLFLDEPFSSLDADLRGEARQLVKTTIARYGIPTLLITHDESDVADLANEVCRIKGGRLQEG